ncbi:MAG: aspartate-semialdehyde dehydrogenase, partial [Planctomycetes bacterium]|nr:aspartate-semialdehyde dehydrogenase [Planctomycetota bacterium]
MSRSVAIVGATGAVGRELLAVLEERRFPLDEIHLYASERSEGRSLPFRGLEVPVRTLAPSSFDGVHLAFFSAGAERSRRFAPEAVARGAVVIDNSSAFRLEDQVPLVVPEVNPAAICTHRGLIANPNCSTIQMVVALAPIHAAVRIRRVVVATYQAVSGAGARAIDELERQVAAHVRGEVCPAGVFPFPIAFNCLPHVDSFERSGYTREEM